MTIKDFAYAPAPRDHTTHPHGFRVLCMIEQLFEGIAFAAASRGMRFAVQPQHPADDLRGRFRNSSVVFRDFRGEEFLQVPLFQCLVDLIAQNPEYRLVRDRANITSTLQLHAILDQFTRTHAGSHYAGCGLIFTQLDSLMRQILKTAHIYCVGQISLWPLAVAKDDRDRDMALITLVLRDELELDCTYDYQITLIWNGPMRFERLYEQALYGDR